MLLPEITVKPEIAQVFPGLKIGILMSKVTVSAGNDGLNVAMSNLISGIEGELDAESIRNRPAIKMVKTAYRELGKDPNRYRPAAESLLRRISNRKGLNHVNTVVDCLNMVSVSTGYSICGYDWDKIQGNISFGKGKTGELYSGIGRGELNIENLPVFRDKNGAFGTPTSDSERTLIDEHTSRVLMMIPSFYGETIQLKETLEMLGDYLTRYVGASQLEFDIK